MYTLYGAPGSASLAPHCVLALSGAAFELRTIDLSQPRPAEYLALNPSGRVPTLVHAGRAMSESMAISLWLAERHPEAGLAPALGQPERADYLRWSVYLANTLQEWYLRWFYPERNTTHANEAPHVRERAGQRLEELVAEIDAQLEPGPFLLGQRLSVPDLYLYMTTGWHPDELAPVSGFSRLSRLRERVAGTPALAPVLAHHGMAP